mmetsp:Transcript_11913/g.28862  ORF Transcript_11913/g.28862 Transcript_11913/m.28862 type:complete len:276 (-) Transcript_11913:409-1236(-)|eukprot:g2611.t1
MASKSTVSTQPSSREDLGVAEQLLQDVIGPFLGRADVVDEDILLMLSIYNDSYAFVRPCLKCDFKRTAAGSIVREKRQRLFRLWSCPNVGYYADRPDAGLVPDLAARDRPWNRDDLAGEFTGHGIRVATIRKIFDMESGPGADDDDRWPPRHRPMTVKELDDLCAELSALRNADAAGDVSDAPFRGSFSSLKFIEQHIDRVFRRNQAVEDARNVEDPPESRNVKEISGVVWNCRTQKVVCNIGERSGGPLPHMLSDLSQILYFLESYVDADAYGM